MKKLFLFLIIALISISLSGQYKPVHKRVSEPVKVIALYSSSIILGAIGDGLNDSGNKGWGHFCDAASVGILLTSPFIIDYEKSKWAYYLTSYVGLRIALFDYSYNISRGLSVNYIGGTSTWDRMLGKLNPPNTYLGRGVFLIVGISVPINSLKHR